MLEIFQRILKFSENRGGNLKQGGNASWSQGGWTPLVSLPPKRTFLRPKNSQKRPKLSDYSQVKFQFELHTCPFVYNRNYAYPALKPIKYYFVAMKIGLPLEAVYLSFPRTLYLGYPLLESNGCDFITPGHRALGH